jgi:LmbE family N-acetylglucosaminyl deacetylase
VRELFIYYRVHLDHVAAAHAAVLAMQAALVEAHSDLRARVLRRPEVQDHLQTWMETYSSDRMRNPHGISADLQAEIESRAAHLAPFIHGQRHVEVFVACAW